MKKKILSIMLVLWASLSISAQVDINYETTQVPYKWGGKNGNTFYYIIGETADEYLALRGTYSFFSYQLKIGRYDKETMNLIEVKPLFPKDYIKKGSEFTPTYNWGINIYKDQVYGLFGYKSQKDDNISVYYQKFDKEGNVDGDVQKLIEAPFLKGSAGYFGGTYSYDSSKFLSVYEVPTKNKENQKYSFHVYNIHDMSMVMERDVELPYLDKDVNLIRYDCDNEGNVYGLVKIFDKKSNGKNSGKFTYKIYGFNVDDSDVMEYDFTSEESRDIYINSLIFKVKGEVLYCTGFWGKKTATNISGVYSLRMDLRTGEIQAKDFHEFDKEFIDEFYTEKQVDKADKKGKDLEIKQIVLDHFIINDDGTSFMVGEQFYTYTVTRTTSSGTYTTTYYVYNDIIASKIDEDGKIMWSVKIPKKSKWANSSAHLGYYLHVKNGQLYFIYYDHVENFDELDAKNVKQLPMMWNKYVELVCVQVSENGKKEKERIYNFADKAANKLQLTPTDMSKLSNETFIGPGFVKGKKEVLTRFTVR